MKGEQWLAIGPNHCRRRLGPRARGATTTPVAGRRTHGAAARSAASQDSARLPRRAKLQHPQPHRAAESAPHLQTCGSGPGGWRGGGAARPTAWGAHRRSRPPPKRGCSRWPAPSPRTAGWRPNSGIRSALAQHIRRAAKAAGHPSVAGAAQSTVPAILRDASIRPHKIECY